MALWLAEERAAADAEAAMLLPLDSFLEWAIRAEARARRKHPKTPS